MIRYRAYYLLLAPGGLWTWFLDTATGLPHGVCGYDRPIRLTGLAGVLSAGIGYVELVVQGRGVLAIDVLTLHAAGGFMQAKIDVPAGKVLRARWVTPPAAVEGIMRLTLQYEEL